MSFNEDQYSPNRPNSHRKNNRQLIVGAENKASRPTSFLNPNNVEAPKGYHVMPGGNLMSDALHKMMCGGEHKKLPKAMFGMTTGHEDPPNEPTAEQKRKAAIEFGRNLQSTLEYPRNFDKWETVDWSKVGHGQKVPKIFINKDFDKSYISVPQAGKVYFKDMTEATYPEGYIGDTRYFIHGDNKIIPYNVNPKELGLNWRMNKRNEFFSDLRDIKAMEYQQKFGDSDYVNPENTTFATGGEVMELTDDEIQKLKDGGAHIVELDQMADGDEVPTSLKKQLQNYSQKWAKVDWGSFSEKEHDRKLKQAMDEYRKIEGAPDLDEMNKYQISAKFQNNPNDNPWKDYGFVGGQYGMQTKVNGKWIDKGWVPSFQFDGPIEDVVEKLPTKKFDPIPEPQIIPRENKPVPPIQPEKLAYRSQTIIDEDGNYKVVQVPYAANDGHGWNMMTTPRVVDKRKGKLKVIDAPTFGDGGEVMELTDEEIQKLRDGGAVVIELDLKKKDDTLKSMADGDEKKKKKQTAVISSEGVVKNVYSKEPFDINYRQLGPQEATWTLPGPYASEELKSQEEFVSDTFNKYGEVAKPYTVEFDELVVYPTDELKGKQEKLIKSYEDTFKKLWQYGAHEGLGLPKSNRIKDLEKWNKDASAKVKELDQRHNKTKADVEKIRKKLGYENAEDVLSVNGLNDFRKLYKDKKISSSEFMSAYENYLKYYDPNMVTLSKEDRQELENIWNGPVDDQGRRRWMGKPRNVTKVGAGVALAAPFAPFIPAALANPLVQAGLTGYGVYDAATNRLPQAYRDFSEGNYGEGFLNLGSAALDLMPGMVFDDMYRAGKAIKQPLNQLTNPFKYRSEIKEAKTAYNDLLKALSTPEGARRLKTMGIDNPQDMVAPKLKISFGDQSHYNIRENVISFNPKKGVKLNENRLLSPSSIINHEGGHWIQREALFQNALKQHAEDLPKFLEANKVSSPLGKKVVSDLHKLKTPTRTTIGMGRNTNVDDFLLQLKQNKGNLRGKQVTDYDYFTKTHEPFAFAREMRQNMVDMGIIKHPYDPISKDEIAAFMLYQNPSRSDRMSSFLIPNEHNVNLLHTFMNNAPAVIGTAGVGTGLLMNSNYADGGEVMELTDKEIQELRKGGHIVIES